MMAYCHKCGSVFPSRLVALADMAAQMMVSNCSESCPRCGSVAESMSYFSMNGVITPSGQNSPEAKRAFELFQQDVVRRLSKVVISRQDARRLSRAVAKKPVAEVHRIASQISPELADVVEAAQRTSKPEKALEFVRKVAVIMATLGAAYGSLMGGLWAHIQYVEKLDERATRKQMIEQLERAQPPDVTSEKTDSEEHERDETEKHAKPDEPIDI